MAKYKPGDEIPIKAGTLVKATLFITQKVEITCSAGTQTYYEGRMWQNGSEHERMCVLRDVRFNEIELE